MREIENTGAPVEAHDFDSAPTNVYGRPSRLDVALFAFVVLFVLACFIYIFATAPDRGVS